MGSPCWGCLILGGKDEIVRYAFDLIGLDSDVCSDALTA